MPKLVKAEYMLKATYVLRHKIRTLRSLEKKARAEANAPIAAEINAPNARKRLRYDIRE